ncbi:DUF1783-domain-containing protein [Xylariaceae sp. FL0804]|nr:DUF1783-domain-containing protein [Xylariaceae sp. FL0804]
MLSRLVQRRALLTLRTSRNGIALRNQGQRRTLIPPPKKNSGPIMRRRADRELPSGDDGFRWWHTLPLFLAVMWASSMAIFNYQRYSSPVVAGALYALRTSPEARALLGDEIQHKHSIPWISGDMNSLRGRIDISFDVRGSRAEGRVRFASVRPTAKAIFETTVWELEMTDGRYVDLLAADGPDTFRGLFNDGTVAAPFAGIERPGDDLDDDDHDRAHGGLGFDPAPAPEPQTRGFRQHLK